VHGKTICDIVRKYMYDTVHALQERQSRYTSEEVELYDKLNIELNKIWRNDRLCTETAT